MTLTCGKITRAGLTLVLLGLLVCSLGISQDVVAGPVYSYIFPVAYPRFTSKFGKRRHPIRKVVRNHSGVDLAAPLGTPIRAIASGVVVFADPYAGYGNLVVLKHKHGITSHYGHMHKIKVSPGTSVSGGEILGTLGNSGESTGPHLHFELRREGKPLDPLKHLPGFDSQPQG